MRRHQGPPPLPPPLGGIVLDGSNVIASGGRRAIERLDLALAWCAGWRPDLPVMVFVDRSTARRCVPAQEEVLRWAGEHHALVVSNDRYFDFEELRRNVVTVQFTLAGDTFTVYDEATWFRSPGSAERVPMATLRSLGAPPAGA
jgi:hypothetical protein